MRIGLLIYGSLESTSGGYLYDRKLVQHLQDQGDTVEVISLPWRSYLHHLGDNFSLSLRKRLTEARLDILLQDELNHPSLFWMNARLRRRIAFPLITIVHHLRGSERRAAWLNRAYQTIERRYLRSVDGFIFNSRTTRQEVRDAGAILERQPSVIAYPAGDHIQANIGNAEITARTHQPGPLRLLFLGNLIPRKGLHVLLEALSSLPEQPWTLQVVGDTQTDPTYTRKIRRQLEAVRSNCEITLCGKLSEGNLAEALRTSHVMVVPSTYEGFGIAYLEGMCFGLPAIATTSGAAGEIITHGQNGFLAQPDDPVDLADYLSTLVHDRQRLAVMSLAARQRYERHPTWEQTGERIRDFLLRVIAQLPRMNTLHKA